MILQIGSFGVHPLIDLSRLPAALLTPGVLSLSWTVTGVLWSLPLPLLFRLGRLNLAGQGAQTSGLVWPELDAGHTSLRPRVLCLRIPSISPWPSVNFEELAVEAAAAKSCSLNFLPGEGTCFPMPQAVVGSVAFRAQCFLPLAASARRTLL